MTSERTIYVGLASNMETPVMPVGILKLARRGVIESGEFAYGQRYLQSPDAIALNPDHLPLQNASFALPERRLRDGGALPLTLRDALPDSWGRKVLEAKHGKTLDDIDALLMTNADRVGAMVFAELLPIEANTPETDLIALEDLSEAVHRLELSMEITPDMRRLLNRVGTLGGARPKATFIHDERRWIAKFPAQSDDHDVEIVEAATLALADKCGIDVSPFHLEPIHRGHALLVQRFDRDGPIHRERRIHFLSASALLDVPYESSNGSYVELGQKLRRISLNAAHDLHQLFLRMVFNLIVDNSDDHIKNHGVLHTGNNRYRLAPAFDLVIQLTNIGYQQLAILPGLHTSHLKYARQAAAHFGISDQDANNIIMKVHNIAHNEFKTTLASYGADESLIARVKTCLDRQSDMINGVD